MSARIDTSPWPSLPIMPPLCWRSSQKVDENGREVGMASADYFGEFSRIMPFRIGGVNPPNNFVAMMTNGASGDINNLVFTAPGSTISTNNLDCCLQGMMLLGEQSKIENYETKPLIATCLREIDLPTATK